MTAALQHDVLIIGGGPSGATAALQLARAGVDVAIIEKHAFPRFRLGESLIPENFNLIRELGLLDRVRALPHVVKLGAEFGMGGGTETSLFRFSTGMSGQRDETLNIARARFDAMLLDAAVEAGATLYQPREVTRVDQLRDGDTRISTSAGPLRCKYILDGSGQATVLARHLGIRHNLPDDHLRKVAYFEHFTGCDHPHGDMRGCPTIAMSDEGWIWMIPLDETTTSVGFVARPELTRQINVPANRMLAWGIEHCPLIQSRMQHARGPVINRVTSDFSYRCRPMVGRGYFLLGDAATFMDPVFSTGVCLGMMHGKHIGELLPEVLAGRLDPRAARQQYVDASEKPTRYFTHMIDLYYQHAFRELFLSGQGPLGMHRAVLSLLAGHVFPKPSWSVRWRCHLFDWCVRVQRHVALGPRRERFSMLSTEAVELPWARSPMESLIAV
jgi:flavin-dependent dehydrogenase